MAKTKTPRGTDDLGDEIAGAKPTLNDLLDSVARARAEWVAGGRSIRSERAVYRQQRRDETAAHAIAAREEAEATEVAARRESEARASALRREAEQRIDRLSPAESKALEFREHNLSGEVGVRAVGWGQVILGLLVVATAIWDASPPRSAPGVPTAIAATIGLATLGLGLGLVGLNRVCWYAMFYLAAVAIGHSAFRAFWAFQADDRTYLTLFLFREAANAIYLIAVVYMLDRKSSRAVVSPAYAKAKARTQSIPSAEIHGQVIGWVVLQVVYMIAVAFALFLIAGTLGR